MVSPADYSRITVEDWHLKVLLGQWNSRLQSRVVELVRAQAAAHHPQTVAVDCGSGSSEQEFFLKVFHRRGGFWALKDLVRPTKATRFWRQGLALSAAGFQVPLTIAVGANGRWRMATREFVLTEKIDGVPVPFYLGLNFSTDRSMSALKRAAIRRLAKMLRLFHDLGFVHGDLVASNIFVAARARAGVDFYLMDNDRTRHYPYWMLQSRWKRNLIQLNRMPLPGISLQDRMRFFHAYLNVQRLSHGDRQLARWLELKTRQRRKECDGVDPTVSFRRLMRWTPETASARDV